MENLLLLLQPSNVPDKRVKLEKKIWLKIFHKMLCSVFFHLLRYIQTEKFYWSLITSSQLHRWTLFKNIQQLKSSKKNQLIEKISNSKQQKKTTHFIENKQKILPPYPLYKKKDIDFCRYDFFPRSILHHHITKKQQQQNGNFLISKKISLAEMQFRAQQW